MLMLVLEVLFLNSLLSTFFDSMSLLLRHTADLLAIKSFYGPLDKLRVPCA